MNGQVVLSILGSAGFLVAGLWALAYRTHRKAAALLMSVYCFAASSWMALIFLQSLGQPVWLRAEFQARLPLYAVYLLSIILLALTCLLVGMQTTARRMLLPAAIWGGLVLAVDAGWLAFPQVLSFAGGWSIGKMSAITAALIAGWAACVGMAAGVTIRTLRRTSRYYTPLTYWTLILIIVVAADALIFTGQPLPGNLLRLAAALLAVAVISTPRLPAIDHVLRRSAGALVYGIGAVAIYTAALLGLQVLLGQWTAGLVTASLVSAAVLVLLFTPWVQRLNHWSNRAFSDRTHQDAAVLLRQYSQNITATLDLSRLAALVVGSAGEFLQVKRGYLFLVGREKEPNDQEQLVLRGVKGVGTVSPEDGYIQTNSSIAVYFQGEGRPVTQAEIDHQPYFADLPAQERSWLEDLAAEVYVPICAKGEWIGLLALGPKESGTDYTSRDLALLSTLADQTAVALENTRLVEGLKRLNNEFRRAYSALDQANRHLERLDKTKSDFISIASHELLTPLTLINGASQMLLDDPDLPDTAYHQQLLQKIKAGGDRLHEIVEAMLDLAKIDQRTMELEPQPISLSTLLESIGDEISAQAAGRNLSIEIQVTEDLPPVVGDRIALSKVFHHLLNNAIKFTPDGGRIWVSGCLVEPNLTDLPQGGVEIIVSDNGIGIDPRFQELIFVKFYQTGELALHSSGKTKFKGGGPGLGLAIARGIVEAHNGRIWVESPGYDEENRPGSRFYVVLPLRPGERPAAALPPL